MAAKSNSRVAVLSLDTAIMRTECHQYKNVQTGRFRFCDEKAKVVVVNVIFYFILRKGLLSPSRL